MASFFRQKTLHSEHLLDHKYHVLLDDAANHFIFCKSRESPLQRCQQIGIPDEKERIGAGATIPGDELIGLRHAIAAAYQTAVKENGEMVLLRASKRPKRLLQVVSVRLVELTVNQVDIVLLV